MARIFVGVGSNVGRERNIAGGLSELHKVFGPLLVSSVYESRAVGFPGDNFFNLVVGFDSAESPEAVASKLRDIEAGFGRQRGGSSFAPRTLDLDLLLYDDLVRSDGDPRLPREDVTRYAFVLRPLAEIAAHGRHPVSGVTYSELWAGFDQATQPLWPVKFDLPEIEVIP